MTTPTPKKQNSPENPDSNKTRSNPDAADATGFFSRVRRELKPEEKPIHPSEEAEIVIMGEEDEDEKTRL